MYNIKLKIKMLTKVNGLKNHGSSIKDLHHASEGFKFLILKTNVHVYRANLGRLGWITRLGSLSSRLN
jgi:hypothetical protein